MPVVVSDTTPLNYLILADCESVLEKLYGQLFIPPAVLAELGHASAPIQIARWAATPPPWLRVATPASIPERYKGLDLGERQALALAKEIKAELILLDDKAARRVAQGESLKVKGTLGIVADAARANLLDFAATVKKLQRTSMYLGQDVLDEIIGEFLKSKEEKRDGGLP
jgi:predicted nucleic acid-binding protein